MTNLVEAGGADGDGAAELGAGGGPRRGRATRVAEKGPGVLSNEEIRRMDLLVAAPA